MRIGVCGGRNEKIKIKPPTIFDGRTMFFFPSSLSVSLLTPSGKSTRKASPSIVAAGVISLLIDDGEGERERKTFECKFTFLSTSKEKRISVFCSFFLAFQRQTLASASQHKEKRTAVLPLFLARLLYPRQFEKAFKGHSERSAQRAGGGLRGKRKSRGSESCNLPFSSPRVLRSCCCCKTKPSFRFRLLNSSGSTKN